jgi:hypothetical protein
MRHHDELMRQRSEALESEFFRRYDAALVGRMRYQARVTEERDALAEASGIIDERVLDELLRLGIRARTVAPLALVPLVEVAWADGKMDPREMEAVLAAAASVGLPPASPGYELLESWLAERPAPALRQLWTNYIHSLCQAMSPEAQRELRDDVLGRARRVAEAAGGVLGLGSRVSSAEAVVLNDLAAAFGA